MRSALFVDFDNVYSGLRRLDPSVAERFAHQPSAWIQWLSESLPPPTHSFADASRRLLVRRCYLNPQVYQRFRPAFNRAGFEIIDCPAMTHQGKTSTDIHMVLDIVDLLQHEVHYDEFIVFSADADFTPVLRKLRRWDRRTTVLAVGFPSAAYQASADLLIDQDEFIRGGLGFEEQDDLPRPDLPAQPAPEISRDIARFIAKAVADSAKPVALPWLASKLPREVKGLDTANWAGFDSFRSLVESLQLSPLLVNWELGLIRDPARHPLTERPTASPRKAATSLASNSASKSENDVMELISQVHAATGMPLLSSREIHYLLRSLATDLTERPFLLTETGKRVRDRCRDDGYPISRSDVSFVLKGILLGGHSFGQGQDGVENLGGKFVESIVDLCGREQLAFDDSQNALLSKWINNATS